MHSDGLNHQQPMAQGIFSMREFWGGIYWNDEILAQLRKVSNQIHPHPYNKDTRDVQAVGVQSSTQCGES